ncbi:MAG: hypothetical protein HYX72_14750 [Acidobacteria bacterium]|nr:hypothetical protein [Acidobacteriota bacterium]
MPTAKLYEGAEILPLSLSRDNVASVIHLHRDKPPHIVYPNLLSEAEPYDNYGT